MAAKESSAIARLTVEGVVLPPLIRPPGCSETLLLVAAGERGLDVNGVSVVYTVHGLYLEDSAVQSLAGKWKGKTADEIAAFLDFYRDIVKASFEKLSRGTLMQPLTGQQFSQKIAENCVAIWRTNGVDVDEQGEALAKFYEIFRPHDLLPNSLASFAFHASGALEIVISKDGAAAESGSLIESRALSEALLESIIGEHGVSPALKRCLAARVAELLSESDAGEKQGERPVHQRLCEQLCVVVCVLKNKGYRDSYQIYWHIKELE